MSTALFNLDSDGTLEILISRANIKKITRVMIAEPGRKTAKNFLLDTQPLESEWELNPGRCTCEHFRCKKCHFINCVAVKYCGECGAKMKNTRCKRSVSSWGVAPFGSGCMFVMISRRLPGEWGGAALSGAAPLGYPLDYHPRSVVNWLTRWTFGNSSCKPVTCSVGGGLLFCPLFEQFRPNPPLDGFGELEKLFAHAVHSLLS